MSSVSAKIVVIAIDGLDWQLLQQFVDEGQMPFCHKLLEHGASGKLNIPPPHTNAAAWTTVATGVMADKHGVCHDLEVREDGLTLQNISSQALKAEPFWHSAMAAGKSVRVAGWPATFPAMLPSITVTNSSCIVSNGVEKSQPSGETCWPLAPEAIAPKSIRDDILDLLVHPQEITGHMLTSLVSKTCRDAGLLNMATGLLAEIASIHNIGTMWAQQSTWDLLTLKFNCLPIWLTATAHKGINPIEALLPWYRYLDLMIGRYMALVGRETHIMLLSDHGLSPNHHSQADALLGVKAAGSIIVCGPDVPPDQLLSNSSGLDIYPTVLSLLGLARPSNLKGRALFTKTLPVVGPSNISNQSVALTELINPPAIDQGALSWLQQHGCEPADLSPLTNMVNIVKAETMAAWAAAKYVTGNDSEAIEALQNALELQPQHLGLRLSLAEKLLEAGRADECKKLVAGLPPAAQEGHWPDVIASILAVAEKNWPVAEQHLLKLAESNHSPINALGWLGHTKLAQQQWLAAQKCYQTSFTGPGELSGYYEGLGLTHLQLNEVESALGAFSHAIALQPLNTRYLLKRALSYKKLGKRQLAQQDLWRALAIDSTLMEAHSQLATLFADTDI